MSIRQWIKGEALRCFNPAVVTWHRCVWVARQEHRVRLLSSSSLSVSFPFSISLSLSIFLLLSLSLTLSFHFFLSPSLSFSLSPPVESLVSVPSWWTKDGLGLSPPPFPTTVCCSFSRSFSEPWCCLSALAVWGCQQYCFDALHPLLFVQCLETPVGKRKRSLAVSSSQDPSFSGLNQV